MADEALLLPFYTSRTPKIQSDHFWLPGLHGIAYTEDSLTQWTIVILGIASLAISAIAVRLVSDTLRENRLAVLEAKEANSIARDTAQRQLRPYLYLWNVSGSAGPRENLLWITVKIDFRNGGVAPAILTGSILKSFLVVDGRCVSGGGTSDEGKRHNILAPGRDFQLSTNGGHGGSWLSPTKPISVLFYVGARLVYTDGANMIFDEETWLYASVMSNSSIDDLKFEQIRRPDNNTMGVDMRLLFDIE